MMISNDDDKLVKLPTVREGIPDSLELNHLLFAISEAFPMVITVNLTQNTFKMLEYENFTTKRAPVYGVFDDLIAHGADTMFPAHRQRFLDAFSRENLLRAHARGEKKVELEIRQLSDAGKYIWVRTTVVFLTNPDNNDVLEITLSRSIEDLKNKEQENARLQTVVEMAVLSSFEYISIIHLQSGRHEVYADDGSNTHNVPSKGDYDTDVRNVCDTLVLAEDRSEFLEHTKLSNVIEHLNGRGGTYRFRYRLADTAEHRWREGVYQYGTPDKEELLLTIRDVHSEVLAEQAKRLEDKLRRDKERQLLLTGLGFDVIIDVDLITRHAELLGEARDFLQRDILCDNFPQGEINAGMVHPEDVNALRTVLESAKGKDSFSVDFRYRRGEFRFFWCRCKAVIIKDEVGRPSRCICKLTDIDEQKRSDEKLLFRAQRDLLTGLYNSVTTELLINDYLTAEGIKGRHGLMVIDADDFKLVNDSWGHQSGDRVLRFIAGTLNASFRPSDIVGRIGGDEFVVFMKNIRSSEDITTHANKLRGSFKPVYLSETSAKFAAYVPACSIGIAIYPNHGDTYSHLFRAADAALYEIKKSGKNNVKLFTAAES